MKRLLFFVTAIVLLINIIPLVVLKFIKPNEIKFDLSSDKTVRVWMSQDKKVKVMPLEEYLVGVVAAEMPAAFELEALKAQVIAARTYTIHKSHITRDVVGNPHPDADVCDSPLHCQAWISEKEQNKRWGRINSIFYRNKIKQAVAETKGLVVTHDGKLIDPVYHSTCGGHTEDAVEVWKYDAPYLKGVSCDYDKKSPRYNSSVTVSLKQLHKVLGTKKNSRIKITERTTGGRVKTLKVGDKSFSGAEIRTKLNLNSAKFDVKIAKDSVTFDVTGYGHGVGMCQFGAGGLAKEGKNYEEILTFYYNDIKITKAY